MIDETDEVLSIRRYAFRCRHNKYIVDRTLSAVECGICGERLNPIWVLEQLCDQESRARQHLNALKDKAEKAKEKNRCKCEHCKNMTRIQR